MALGWLNRSGAEQPPLCLLPLLVAEQGGGVGEAQIKAET